MDVLIKHGANVNAKTTDNITPLSLATKDESKRFMSHKIKMKFKFCFCKLKSALLYSRYTVKELLKEGGATN